MLTAILIGVIFFVKSGIEAQVVSPCPNLFIYEGKSPEPDQWYGIVTLKSDTDLSGVWLRLIFDRPSLQLGVSFLNNLSLFVTYRINCRIGLEQLIQQIM